MLSGLDGHEILIYDNASKDDTVTSIRKNYSDVRLIASSTNHGYGRAANKAFKLIDSPFALLLNPDVVIQREQVDALIKITDQLGNNWLFVAPATGSSPVLFDDTDDKPLPRIKFAEGCALLINLRQHWILGGFDENFFLFYEETDLCQRAMKNEVDMYFADSVSLPHASGKSVVSDPGLNDIKRWHYQWSFLYYCKKHHFWWPYYSNVLKNLIIYPIKLLYVNDKSKKSRIYRSRRAATLAFLKGKGAFDENGVPFKPAPLL
jgi:GT2 family glycosyltransferase